jgi:hypothetical protein
MNPDFFRQKAHDGAVLQSASGCHNLADAGNYSVIRTSPMTPSAIVLIVTMIVVGKQGMCLIARLVIIKPLAVNEGRIQWKIDENMNRTGHIRVHQTDELVIARLRECHRKVGAAAQTSLCGNTCAAVEVRPKTAGHALD